MQNKNKLELKSKRLQLLIDRHQQLDDTVDELAQRRVLLPSDRQNLKRLKVIRLYAKEAISRFKLRENITE
jgi:uncharacterized protein YdcH (DUF465 family)